MRFVVSMLVVASLLLARRSFGQDATPSEPAHRLEWTYPRFRVAEYVAAGSVTAAHLALLLGTNRIPEGSWKNGVFFDDSIRSALRASTQEGRDRAGSISDALWYGTALYPIVIDSLLVPLAFDRGNTDVAFQMILLDWQAEELTGLITLGFHRTVGRARPFLKECTGPGCSPPNSGNNASFISGHTSTAFTGAGLVCAHHQALSLYGNAVADAAACGVMLGAAVTTGTLRIVADKHWTTDVIAGAVLGFGSGWLLPYALHYAHFRAGRHGPTLAVVPSGGPDGFGLSVMGVE